MGKFIFEPVLPGWTRVLFDRLLQSYGCSSSYPPASKLLVAISEFCRDIDRWLCVAVDLHGICKAVPSKGNRRAVKRLTSWL
jgi:hypothetical protein